MRFRELSNANQNELDYIYVYYTDDQWEDEVPEYMAKDINNVQPRDLNSYVDAWFTDVNFCLHVLLA